MHHTIFDTPLVRPAMAAICRLGLWLAGWKLKGDFPDIPKYVLIAVPHTSNWDFPVALGLIFAGGARSYWMGKHTIFNFPFGTIMRWLGGVPVDRRQAGKLVQQVITAFEERDNFVITIPPEGTRQKVADWKTGFYHIAVGAKVPIVLGYLDFQNKLGGCLGVFHPTGDIASDLPKIQAFYQGIQGKRPHRQ